MKIYDGQRDGDSTEDGGTAEGVEVRRSVGVADFAVTDCATLMTSGLGSCVAVGITDGVNAAGLAHVMLPSADDREIENPAKYADTGVATLIAALEEANADRGSLRAKIAGGSEMIAFPSLERSIGDRNVAAVRAALASEEVPLVAEHVGGDEGRTVEFSLSGDLVVKSAGTGVRTL